MSGFEHAKGTAAGFASVGTREAEAARREPRSLVRTSWKSVGFYLPDREAEGRVLVTEWRR